MKKILTVTLLLEVSLFSVQAQQTGKLFKKKYIKKTMGKEPFLLEAFEFPQIKAETGANTGADLLTNAHMKNWMGCVRANNVKTNAPDEAGYSHSIANIMTTAALRTGQRAALDEKTKQVITGGKPFKY